MVQTYSQQTWANAFLAAIGNATPSQSIRNFVIGWEKEEGGGLNNDCQYNSLNTTQAYNGSTSCNSVGVQSFPDFNSGVQANAMTLANGYPSLYHALQTNDANNLGMASQPMANNVAGDLSKWVSGSSNPIQTSYIKNIEQIAGGNTGGGGQIYQTDPCLNCGTKDTAAYQQCHAALAAKVGAVPDCAKGAIQANQQAIQRDPMGTLKQAIQDAILGPIEQSLPNYLIHAGLFAFALILVVFGFVILQE